MDFIACVRFLDNKTKNDFAYVKEVKYNPADADHIRPKTVDDFDSQHEYNVLWCLCKTEECEDEANLCKYYKAYIACLAESLEEAKVKANLIRFRFPKKIFSPSDQESSTSLSQQNQSQVLGDKLQIKLENLNTSRVVVNAKKAAAKKHLLQYAKDNFMFSRTPLTETSDLPSCSKQDNISTGIFDKPQKLSRQPSNKNIYNGSPEKVNFEDVEVPADEDDNKRGRCNRRPLKELVQRDIEPPAMDAGERAIKRLILKID